MSRKCGLDSAPTPSFRKNPSLHERLIQCKTRSFEEDYIVKQKIGEGSFGSVYEVEHKTLGLKRALKVIRNTQTEPYPSKEEIDVLCQLDHPNILRLYEFYEVKNKFFLVTEFFEGEELFAEIIKHNPFTEQKACEIADEILKALNYTHIRGIAHRDIKAENILVKCEEGRWTIKIVDWGLGTIVGNGELVRKCGTPEYVAPEVFSGHYNNKCDMWSFGVILYIMLMGEMPFKGKTPMDTVKLVLEGDFPRVRNWSKLSNEARDLLSNLLMKDPSQRLSANDCLIHPWMNLLKESNEPPKLLNNTLAMIKNLHISNTLGLAAFSFINNFLANELDKRELNRIFNWLDKDHNGVLSHDELLRGYSVVYGEAVAIPIVESVFAKLDTNHSGVLEYNEFIAYALNNGEEDKFKEAFKIFDVDEDGCISVAETKALLCSSLNEEEFNINEIIHQFDENGDGLIDENEFLKCLKSLSKMFASHEYLKKGSFELKELLNEEGWKKDKAKAKPKPQDEPNEAKEDDKEKTNPPTDIREDSLSQDNKDFQQPVRSASEHNEHHEQHEPPIEPVRKKGRPKKSERKPYIPEPTTR